MNLSIILLTNNKEVLINVKRKKDPSDDITTLKLSSKKLTDTLNGAISESKNDNVLIINPNDQDILRNTYFETFRKSNDIIINNLRPDKSPSRKTSIKLNKSKGDKANVRCNNLCEYITNTISKNDKVNEANEIEEEEEEEEAVEEIEEPPIEETVEEAPPIKTPKPIGKKSERFKGDKNKRPKILFICDVKGGAGWLKSQYLKKYLSDEFDIDIIHLIGKGKKSVDRNKYDLYFTFGYSYVNYLKKVPKHKRISGVTAHRDNKVLKAPLSQVNYVHANSILLRDQIKGIHNNIYYTPNGVDSDMFYKKNEYDLMNKDQIIMGHVGKKSPMKCQQNIIEPVAEKLKQYSIKYFSHYNDYTNPIPHTKMPDLYQDMNLFIVASIEDGTPNGALESMACGVPVISNRIGNMPEVIVDGYNGYIVEDGKNTDSYINIIKNLDREHLIEMGKNARQTIVNSGTGEIQSENYRKMFRDILKV